MLPLYTAPERAPALQTPAVRQKERGGRCTQGGRGGPRVPPIVQSVHKACAILVQMACKVRFDLTAVRFDLTAVRLDLGH